jgi:hypothetical protein
VPVIKGTIARMIELASYKNSSGFSLKNVGLSRCASLAWQLLLVLLCAAFLLSFVYLVLANYWPGPYEDYWAEMPLIEGMYTGTLSLEQWIIAHNNSHRVLLPRLLFLADYQLASGTNTFLITTALLFKLVLVIFFNYQMVTRRLTERLLFNAIIFMAIFNSALVYNTVFNINIQWDMMLLFSLSAIACFHHHYQGGKYSTSCFVLAYVLFFCAALTHAGGFLCLPVFWIIAIYHKRYKDLLLPIGLFIGLFYITFYVLPVSHPDAPTFEMMIFDAVNITEKLFMHFFQLLSVGIHRDYPKAYLYFSSYVIALAIFNMVIHRKIEYKESNFWVFASVFMLITIFVTSSARIGWIWTALAHEPRFKVLSLFLLMILTLHCLLIVRHFSNSFLAVAIRGFVIIHSVALMLLAHQLNFNLNFTASNNNLSTHAFMLLKGVNRENGRWLGRNILFREERDPVAHMDSIFQSRGLVYYHNKVTQTRAGLITHKTGDLLVAANQLSSFAAGCTTHTSSMEIRSDEGIAAIFSTQIDPDRHSILLSSINRDSYFVLDKNGLVTGYAYIYVETDTEKLQTYIRGISTTDEIHFVAEISHNQPTCLYQILP